MVITETILLDFDLHPCEIEILGTAGLIVEPGLCNIPGDRYQVPKTSDIIFHHCGTCRWPNHVSLVSYSTKYIGRLSLDKESIPASRLQVHFTFCTRSIKMSETEARQRRPPKPQLPVDIDKDKLKKAFDISHFDLNAILRGVELTLVGGMHQIPPSCCQALTPSSQQISSEPGFVQFRTLPTGCYCCRRWHCHPPGHLNPCMFS